MSRQLTRIDGPAPIARPADPAPEDIAIVEDAMRTLKALRTFIFNEFKQDVDYGTIPGTPKPTLYQAGAQKASMYFNATPRFRVTVTELGDGHMEVVAVCLIRARTNGKVVADGEGSCSTMETKYRWRPAKRLCPACQADAIIVGKPEYGGGYICFSKKGGCGAKFAADDRRITGQRLGRMDNPDIWDLRNTVRKIARKRAMVAAALNLGCLSEVFTQDIEDGIYDLGELRQSPATAPSTEAVPESEAHHAEHHDNQTGVGRTGAYASPGSEVAYRDWLKTFVEDVNDKWLTIWTDERGDVRAGTADLLSTFQMTGHLLKWSREEGLVNAPANAKTAQRDRFVAIVYERFQEELITEAKQYARRKWREMKESIDRQAADKPAESAEAQPDMDAEPGDPEGDLPPEPGMDG